MGDFFNLYTLLSLFGCLFTGVLFAWLLYRRQEHLEQRLRYLLAIARAIIITLITSLLFFPLIRSITYDLQKPVIVIGQDNSLSVHNVKGANFDQQQYQKDLEELSRELSEKYEVKVYNFSDSVKQGFDFKNKGALTDGVKFFNQLSDELINRNVGAVVLASDGIFNSGGSPLYELNRLNAPVYTIGLGDTIPKKDIMLSNVSHNDIVYLDNEFTVEIQVQALEGSGGQTRISVVANGSTVYQDRVLITSDAYIKNIPIRLKASKLGLQKYTIQLSPIADEASLHNNKQDFFIEVIDARQKVLIAAPGPHPDIAALKQAIQLNKHYELKVALADELRALNPSDYGLIILYQLPSIQIDAGNFISKVRQSKASLWYIIGAQSDLSSFNQSQSAVNYAGTNQSSQELFGYANPDFTVFNIDPATLKVIENYDPLQAPTGKITVRGDAMAALNQRIGKIRTPYPQLFFLNDDSRKFGYLIGEGVWRWKLADAELSVGNQVFNTLINSVVQYLSVKDDKRKFKAYPAKNTFDENENILINAVLYNDSYLPVNTPDVNMQIKNDAGKTYNYLFSKTESAYQLNAGSLPAGSYAYVATTSLGNNKHIARGTFYVNALLEEYQQTTANHQLLNAMSAETNGKLYMPQDLLKILKDIAANDQIKTLSYESRKYQEPINFKWLFALILALLSLEWFFRKRNGEI